MIELRAVAFERGRFRLPPTTLTVASGEQVILTGPTGCGKTTVLELIAGLEKPSFGSIFLNGRDVAEDPPAKRGIGYVPQDATLFRTMTVAENLGFGLAARGVLKEAIARRVRLLAEQLGLAELLSRPATQLSGGEAQRTSFGRAVAFEPIVLLLDEPFHAQDEDWRRRLRDWLQREREARSLTILHVSHSPGDHSADGVRKIRLRDCRTETT